MKAQQFRSNQEKRRQAMALIMVTTTVALISILIVAIFSVTQTEYKATQSYVAGRNAKQLADMAVNIVEAQIQNGQNTSFSDRTIHATQPGMVRVYRANGVFKEAYKLYSSSKMKVTGSESSLLSSENLVPSDWNSNTQKARYVDLNEPVIRPGVTAGSASVIFPVIDPRAALNSLPGAATQYSPSNPAPSGAQTSQVEGFWYEKNTTSGQTYTEVVTPLDTNDGTKLRLPMPVEWLYILEDGTTGALDSSNRFVSSNPAVQPQASNPIVGRVAFWTDDESCKINVNTAAEPTFSGTPFYYHERDRRWAHFPGTTGEYQRYPGHPATVALSSVLAPNMRLDPLSPDPGFSDQNIVDIKEKIYALMPKISGGGSYAGTRPFVNDYFSTSNGETASEAQLVVLDAAKKERLFASIDEMIFTDALFDTTNGRVPAKYNFPAGTRVLFDHDTLERSRFFLTAHSRSPEFSIHGLPRVCIWPVHENDSVSNPLRTNFDNAIALASTLKSSNEALAMARSYFFRRSRAHNGDYDVGISRNDLLLKYLVSQMSSLTWPATSNLGSSTSFLQKYGISNVNQLAAQFFDYVRCTNLYDGILARGNTDGLRAQNKSGTDLYAARDTMANTYKTFTNQRITDAPTSINQVNQSRSDNWGVVPGHGQVTPAVWKAGTGAAPGGGYRGFGRSITLSELGFHFICTADGDNDANAIDFGGVLSGGGTAPRVDPTVESNTTVQVLNSIAYPGMFTATSIPKSNAGAVWYSNFPRLSKNDSSASGLLYGTVATGIAARHPSRHPGYDPKNWNLTLEQDTPLLPGQSRIQAVVLLEAFCPSLGWTKIRPEYTIELDGDYVGQIFLTDSKGNKQRLFDTSGALVIKSNGNLYEGNNNAGSHPVGGHSGPSNIAGDRFTRSINGNIAGRVSMPSDATDPQDPTKRYNNGNTQGHQSLRDYAFTSNFLTVANTGRLTLEFPGGDFVIKIHDSHNWGPSTVIQTIKVNLRDSKAPTDIPVPVLYGSAKATQLRTNAGYPAQINMNYDQRIDGYGRIKYTRSRQGPHYWCYNFGGALYRMSGQVSSSYGQPGKNLYQNPPIAVAYKDTIPGVSNEMRQAVRGRLDTEQAMSSLAARPGTPDGVTLTPDSTSDVIRTLVPTVGDYRIIAARREVPASMWRPHPSWNTNVKNLRQAHSFTSFLGTNEAGAKLAIDPDNFQNAPEAKLELQLVGDVQYNQDPKDGSFPNPTSTTYSYNSRQPDFPGHPDWAAAANSFGDFDTGIGNAREGPYINKPDEGNFYAGPEEINGTTKRYYRGGYFHDTWKQSEDWRSGIYMTPNRLIPSAVMFGSLPTGVWGGHASANPNPLTGTLSDLGSEFRPWQTLLFRPHAYISTKRPSSKERHPGEANPRDHYLLDMFSMPVVEPYAISEPLSVAGRINLNYQIMPFTNITRATGIYALMKGEMLTAIPNIDVAYAKSFVYRNRSNIDLSTKSAFSNEQGDQRFWHRPINIMETLRQFDERFSHDGSLYERTQGLFRSASQICEIHLIPTYKAGAVNVGSSPNPKLRTSSRQTAVNEFWANCRATGDNVRERPYANLYSRVTTRSNTFRVHVRAQTIKKARSVDVATFDPTKDAILSDYRGSMLIERYIDLNETDPNRVPDYAATGISSQPLDQYYKFRVLETKRFNR